MKNQLFSIIVLALLTLTACKQAETSENTTATEKEPVDNITFEKRAEIMRTFIKAHAAEDLETLSALLADTLRWSPPSYSETPWKLKEDYLAVLKDYHDNFENIRYTEGINLPNGTLGGFFGGSAYSNEGGSNNPNGIRCYGTWHGTHSETGKKVGVKWYGIVSFNEDNKIAMLTEYWDVHGLAAQLAEE